MSAPITFSDVSTTPSSALDALLASSLSVSFLRLNTLMRIEITRRVYGIDGAATRFSTEKDDTFRIDASDGSRYVLKISNPGETAEELDLQVAAMRHVAVVAPGLPVPRVLPGIDGQFVLPLGSSPQPHRTARLYSYLEGMPLDALHPSARNRYEIGEVLAQLRLAMAGFRHPHEHRVLAWDVKHLSSLTGLQAHIADPCIRSLIEQAFARFAAIEPALRRCPDASRAQRLQPLEHRRQPGRAELRQRHHRLWRHRAHGGSHRRRHGGHEPVPARLRCRRPARPVCRGARPAARLSRACPAQPTTNCC